METLKRKSSSDELSIMDDQSVTEHTGAGNHRTCNAAVVQSSAAPGDTDIINEVDSLLHLYKIALDGQVWSNLDSIFDHVQHIEYELAPEPEIPVVFDEEDFSLDIAEERDEPVEDSCSADTAHTLFERAAAYLKQNKKLALIVGSFAAIAIVFLIIFNSVNVTSGNYKDRDGQLNSKPQDSISQQTGSLNTSQDQTALLNENYHAAVALMDAEKYDEAVAAFETLDGYQDSAAKMSECHYINATALAEEHNTLRALNEFTEAGNYKDAPEQAAALRKAYLKSQQMQTISAGRYHTAALKPDGTVVAVGDNDIYQCDVSGWTDIVSICVGDNHTVGLKADGTVMHIGAINYGQRSVTEWWDIAAIRAGRYHTIGLKVDGTVVSAGRSDYGQGDVWTWSDITAISTGAYHTVGLKTDGTVVAVGNNTSGQCDVSDWKDIIAVYAGDNHTIGLKANGSVVSVGYNAYGQCDISEWTNIVDIGIGTSFTVGLKADGTVVTVGYPYGDLNEVSTWSDIVDISVEASHITGLKADGTVITANYDSDDQAAISGWTDIKLPG